MKKNKKSLALVDSRSVSAYTHSMPHHCPKQNLYRHEHLTAQFAQTRQYQFVHAWVLHLRTIQLHNAACLLQPLHHVECMEICTADTGKFTTKLRKAYRVVSPFFTTEPRIRIRRYNTAVKFPAECHGLYFYHISERLSPARSFSKASFVAFSKAATSACV